MKYKRFFRVLAAAVILALLMIAIPATPALAAGDATLLPNSGPPDTVITVSGEDFPTEKSGEAWFDIDGDSVRDTGEYYDTLETDVDGYIAPGVYLTAPTVARGSYYVRVEVDGSIEDSVTFTIEPEIELDDDEGYVGDTVTVDGCGFKADDTVTIYYDSTSVGTDTADEDGVFEDFTFTVPASTEGDHDVRGKDDGGYSSSVTFTVEPKITLNPSSGAVGGTVTVDGTGFAASSDVDITFDAADVDSATTNSSGSFSASFTVPSTSRGSHTIKAEDEDGNDDTATFSVSANISLSQTTGSAGTSVTVTGNGFGASRSITITYNNASVSTNPSSVTTNSAGYFNASFTVPAGLAGVYVVKASDGITSATANFTSTTDATISQTTSAASPGYVGMPLTITGLGFTPSGTATVRYDTAGEESVTLTSVDITANGSFTAEFTIPPSLGGTHNITVDDGTVNKVFTFVMEENPPPTPEITAPLADTKLKDDLFDWEAVEDVAPASIPVSYDIQISLDDTFSSESLLLYKVGLTETSYTLLEEEKLESASEEAPYYWRVRALDAASNASAWSEATPFTTGWSFEFTGWVIYAAMGLIAIVFFFIGLAVGRRSGGGGYY